MLEPLAYLDPKRKINQLLIVEIINFYFNTKFFDYSWDKFNKSYNYDIITKFYPANIFFDNFKNKSHEQELFFENMINFYKNQICNTYAASDSLKEAVKKLEF